ncbi:GNAT family N-acetyltransferase [Alicyclobacillus fodiniaquatilis]|uniref:GNAT family N-acetyltransferase n=1 Tax=Alicyclobacillus fodiniaquatilis TaxID=1661150 RepID=A0ABW4JKB9_9BACL
MESEVYLSRPSLALQNAYLTFYREWVERGEKMVPWVISRDPTDFQGMIEFLLKNEKGEQLPDGWVPDSTYWMVTGERRIVGVVNIRHGLTEQLLNRGGHIGYGIRPSERRKGYATKLLSLALEKARELGLEKVLVVCDEWNVGSEKTIRKNGGVQDTSYVEDDGNVILRFWIDL